jgi:hypothetical protein
MRSMCVGYDDDQLAALMRTAAAIPIEQRAPFLAMLARAVLIRPDADPQALIARLTTAARNVAATACREGDDCARWEGDASDRAA